MSRPVHAQPPVDAAPPTGDAAGSGPTSAGRLPALGYRDFRLFWFGQMVSLTGTWIQNVAQQWLVLQLTGSAFKLGLVSAVQFTPLLLFSLLGGAIVDRVSRRNLLLATQMIAGLLALFLGILVQTGRVQYWHVVVFAAALGLVNAFYVPARQAFVPQLVDRAHLAGAVALNSAIFNGSRVVGPAIGGLLIAALGVTLNFYLNAASYLAVIVGLMMIRPRPPVRDETRPGLLNNVGEGLRYIGNSSRVLTILLLIGVASLFALNFNILLPLFARGVLHVGSQGYGFLMGAWGVGSLSSAVLLAFVNLQDRSRALIYIGASVFTVAEVAFALSRLYVLSLGLMAVVGFFLTLFTTTANTRVLSLTPDALQGRVMSVYSLMFLGVTPFGSLLTGALAEHFGAPAALIIGAAVTLAFTGLTFTVRRRQRAARRAPA